MTNKEAIEILSNRLNTYYCTDEDLQALDLAVKALAEKQVKEEKIQAYKAKRQLSKERRKAIYARRTSGEKFKDIAADYGLSISRITQLYRREKWEIEHADK